MMKYPPPLFILPEAAARLGKFFQDFRPVNPITDPRRVLLIDWLHNELQLEFERLEPASSDASFRRYFRIHIKDETRIVMDAPPPTEDVRPFIKLASRLRSLGLMTPRIFSENLELGFLLLEDFGALSYLDVLTPDNVEQLYGSAMESLHCLAEAPDSATSDLPLYDRTLLERELRIFDEWCLGTYLDLKLSTCEKALIEKTFEVLVKSALAQPKVLVHRDFHSRNLMVFGKAPGILDFQDAVHGPITYDLVSLLRDCYIDWPEHEVKRWARSHHQQLTHQGGLSPDVTSEQFLAWFDLMGLQRHLKAIGIFSRLHLRDGKSSYLEAIPRTLKHALNVSKESPELSDFATFLEERVSPAFPKTTAP